MKPNTIKEPAIFSEIRKSVRWVLDDPLLQERYKYEKFMEGHQMNHSKTIFEQRGGTYTQVGDYLLPNLIANEAEQPPIGKYGRMRKRYLKEHRPILFTNLLTSGKLYQHMAEMPLSWLQ